MFVEIRSSQQNNYPSTLNNINSAITSVSIYSTQNDKSFNKIKVTGLSDFVTISIPKLQNTNNNNDASSNYIIQKQCLSYSEST